MGQIPKGIRENVEKKRERKKYFFIIFWRCWICSKFY